MVTADTADAKSLISSIVNPKEVSPGAGPGPKVRWTTAEQVKKGEDFHKVQAVCKRGDMTFGMYSVFDGHNGTAAAEHAKQMLLEDVLQHMPENTQEASNWLRSLPLGLAEGFLLNHMNYAARGELSGTTSTVAIIAGWTITVAGVGDSRAILDTPGGGVQDLTVDHRFEDNKEERQRVLKDGGTIARLKTFQGEEVGPMRSWPGGLCVSRSIGDLDCGPHITPLPHVRQVEVPPTGGRLVIASDGLWDALSSVQAAKLTRGMPGTKAASTLIKESIKLRGLRDDITVVVVDLLPADTPSEDTEACPVPKPSKMGKSSSFLSKMAKSTSMSSFRKGKEEPVAPVRSESANDLPNLVNDHDSMKGGNLYERYMTNLSMHAGGSFCKICGRQVEQGEDTETSTRGGTALCEEHRATAASEELSSMKLTPAEPAAKSVPPKAPAKVARAAGSRGT